MQHAYVKAQHKRVMLGGQLSRMHRKVHMSIFKQLYYLVLIHNQFESLKTLEHIPGIVH